MAQSSPGAVVVGTSFGYITHMRALREAGFEVRALVGRNPAKTAERATRAGVPHATTNLQEALALPGVDVVTVATPPHSHAQIVLAAVEAGKHVVCEKPLARDAAEARRMCDAAEAAGRIHLVGTEFRWATGQALATRAIHAGLIGEPRLVTYLLHQPMLADPSGEVPAWWSREEEGGGWLGAYASHVIDQLRHMLGEFEGVSASLSVVSERSWSAEDSYSVHFRTRGGAEGVLQSSAGAWGPPVVASRIAGSKGTLWVEGDAVHVADAAGQRTLEVPDELMSVAPKPPASDLLVTAYDQMHSMGIDLAPFTRLFQLLAARMRGEGGGEDPAPATFEDGAAVMTVLDAIRRSSRERCWVAVE